MTDELPWGDSPYDTKTPAEVVHDYAVVRGDLSEQYARDQLAEWIERYAEQKVADMSVALMRELRALPVWGPDERGLMILDGVDREGLLDTIRKVVDA